jgi:hypothetical protein
MKIQIQINDEITDRIIRAELKWHRDNTKDIGDMCKEDKKYFKKLAPALDIVCEYFGVDKDESIHNDDTKRN